MVTLNTEYKNFRAVTTRLLDINHRAKNLEVEYQKLIAETLLLRLFYELDHCVEIIVLKLLRGAPYLDGSKAQLLCAAFRSQDAAKKHMLMLGRKSKPRYYLEWTTLAKTLANLNGVMSPADHFISTRTLHDGVYENIRGVRNHIAHGTASTKAHYTAIVQGVYASHMGISPAKFLLSQRRAVQGYTGNEMIIAQYIRWSVTFVKLLTRSPV
jgi:hypothetical protein